jgi:hypothetical protein
MPVPRDAAAERQGGVVAAAAEAWPPQVPERRDGVVAAEAWPPRAREQQDEAVVAAEGEAPA